MVTSIDVVGIDPEAAGEGVTDFLESAGLIAVWSAAAVWLLVLLLAVVVVHKAGFSAWWAVLGVLLPPLGLLLLIVFALAKWPVHRERDEALSLIKENDLILPSHAARAQRDAERARQYEEEARLRMERAQADRAKADAEHARIQAAQAAREAQRAQDAAAKTTPLAPVAPAAAPVETPKRTADAGDTSSDAVPADAPVTSGNGGAGTAIATKPARKASTTGSTKTRNASAKTPSEDSPAT